MSLKPSQQTHPSGVRPRNQRNTSQASRSSPGRLPNSLVSLIEQDAPLQNNSLLVLMYGSFQTQLEPQTQEGVGSWLKERIRTHGLPSLVRFGSRHRAQVFCPDQFKSWLEPLAAEA